MILTKQVARIKPVVDGQLSLSRFAPMIFQKTAGKTQIMFHVHLMDVTGIQIHFQLMVVGVRTLQINAGLMQHLNLTKLSVMPIHIASGDSTIHANQNALIRV